MNLFPPGYDRWRLTPPDADEPDDEDLQMDQDDADDLGDFLYEMKRDRALDRDE
jgi:hypothetical protein